MAVLPRTLISSAPSKYQFTRTIRFNFFILIPIASLAILLGFAQLVRLALHLLQEQKINTDKIRSAIYKSLIYPLYAPLLVIIIFFFVPISARFLNVSIFSFIAIAATLFIWGMLFILSELAKNKTIPPEVGIILPVALLFFYAIHQLLRSRD